MVCAKKSPTWRSMFFSPVVPAYWRNLGIIPEHMLSLLRLYLVKAAGNFLTVKWKSHSTIGNAQKVCHCCQWYLPSAMFAFCPCNAAENFLQWRHYSYSLWHYSVSKWQ